MDIILNTGPGIIIAIPTLGRPVPLDWALNFKSLNPPINFKTTFHIIKGREIGDAREEMALNAIKSDAKYIFFLGDDVVVPNHTLRAMIFHLDNNPDIGVIGGVYCAKADPTFPLVFRGDGYGSYWDWKIGEFFEVTGLGMDCTIIRVEVLKELHAKGGRMFETVKSDKFLDGINSAEEWTEDLFFFNRVTKETKWKVYCDGGIICEHWDIYAPGGGKMYTLPKACLPMRQMVVKADEKKLLDVGGNLPKQEGFEIVTTGWKDKVDYRCDPTSMPLDNESFDAVHICNSVLTDILKLAPTIKEGIRCLKKEGILKVTYSAGYSKEWLEKIFVEFGVKITSHDTSLIEGVKI